MKFLISCLLIVFGVVIGTCNGLVCEEETVFGITKYITCPKAFDSREAQYCCGSKEKRYCCSNPLGLDEDDLQEVARNSANNNFKRSATQGATTEGTINRDTAVSQEGFGDNLKNLKDKIKQKMNSTVSSAKDKVKQKAKDKVIKKIEENLIPTGGHMKLPAILGTLFAIVISLIVLCVVCCCCCPFCLLHKRRNRGVVHNPPPGGPTYFYPNPVPAQHIPVMTAPPSGQPGYAPVQTTPYPPLQPYPTHPYPPQQGYVPPPQGYMPQPGFVPPTNAPYPTTGTVPQPTDTVPGDNPPPYAEKQMPFNPNY